ncbi:MAG: LacI family DNA-binding transcriptional regulator [Sedimentisphaerales bacterium]
MRSILEIEESVKTNINGRANKSLRFECSRPTLATVAREAGVAVSTASAILSKKEHCYASEETYARVHHAAKKLGYQPNRFARSLRGGKTNFIGVIFPELSSPSIMLNKLLALEEIAYKEGFRVMFGTHRGDPAREREYLFEFLANNVDGIILNSDMTDNCETVARFVHEGLSIVTIESPYDFAVPDVTIDRELGGYLQVRHILQDVKRKHIAFLRGSSLWSGGRAKIRGHNKALREFASPADAHFVIDCPDVGQNPFQTGIKMAKELLQSKFKFDAVVTSADSLALGAMHELVKSGRRIPEDVAIIGFDDEDFSAALPVPLSTIHQPRDAGICAYELLKAQMNSDKSVLPEKYPKKVLSPHLIVRQSTCGKD